MNEFTVGMLIDQLRKFDPEAPVRLAFQPNWPLEYGVEPVIGTRIPHGHRNDIDPGPVWIGAGDQIGYLPEAAARALGWQRD